MDIKINKFKLITGGYGGMEVWRTEPVRKGKLITLDSVHRTRKVPIDKPLRDQIQKLKYFYLALTRHWMQPFDKYFDTGSYECLPLPSDADTPVPIGQQLLRNLWNDTSVTAVSVRDDGFTITGSIEVVDGKKITLVTPFITSEDDYMFFTEAYAFILKVGDEINRYLYSNLLPLEEARETYRVEHNIRNLSQEDEDNLTEMLIQRFQEKGAIIIMNDNEDMEALEATNGNGSVFMHGGSGTLNTAGLQNENGHEEHESFEDQPLEEEPENDGQIIIGENKGKVPNEFADTTDVPQPPNLEDMERTDQMLIEEPWPGSEEEDRY